MKKIIPGALFCALSAFPALANSHDRQLERWIIEKVANGIGAIRGSVALDEPVVLVTAAMLESRPKMLGWQFREKAIAETDPFMTASVRKPPVD